MRKRPAGNGGNVDESVGPEKKKGRAATATAEVPDDTWAPNSSGASSHDAAASNMLSSHGAGSAAAAANSENNTMRSSERIAPGQRLLVVGEGDFSFSRGLVCNHEDASHLTTTTIRSAAETRSRFQGSLANISDLVSRGSTVLHGVDARSLRSVDGIRDNYDVIFFTFPFAEASLGTHYAPNDPRHAQMVASFLMSASTILRNEGEVCVLLHVTTAGVSQFDTWKVEAAAQMAQLEVVGYHEYRTDVFPGYLPRASSGARFAAQGGRVHVFKRKMAAVYDAFLEELDAAEAANDPNISAAAAEQKNELNAARTVRSDRSIALELSRRVILPHEGTSSHLVITIPFAAGERRCPVCEASLIAESGAGAVDSVSAAWLPCRHVVCVACLATMTNLALREQLYARHLRCPVETCRSIIPPSVIKTTDPAQTNRLHGLYESAVAVRDASHSGADVDLALHDLMKSQNWVLCRCGFAIEKNGGCNTITCRCGLRFCYVCKKELSETRATCTDHVNPPVVPVRTTPAMPRAAPPMPRAVQQQGYCPRCFRTRKCNGRPFVNIEHHVRNCTGR